jgi:hypothetical protein
MAIWIDHGSNPDFPLGEPLLDWILICILDQMVCQEKGNLNGYPLTRMMTPQEEELAAAAAPLPNLEGSNGAIL